MCSIYWRNKRNTHHNNVLQPFEIDCAAYKNNEGLSIDFRGNILNKTLEYAKLLWMRHSDLHCLGRKLLTLCYAMLSHS